MPPDLLGERLLLHDLLTAANWNHRRLVRLRLQGCTMAKITLAQGMSAKQAQKLHLAYFKTERGLNFKEAAA